MKLNLKALFAGAALLGLASAASAATVIPAIPKTTGDAYWWAKPLRTGGIYNVVRAVPDLPPGRLGADLNVPTTAANGVGVVLNEAPGEVGNVPHSDSDYIFAFRGHIWFMSDSEVGGPPLSSLAHYFPGVNPANFVRLGETGNWQKLDRLLGVATPFYVFSNAVPEPATWALMMVGVGGVGFALRRKASKTAISAA